MMILTLLVSSKGTAGVRALPLSDCFAAANLVSFADGAVVSALRDRSVDGYGAYCVTVLGQLRSVCCDCAMGR